MNLTVEHIVKQVEELDKSKVYDYLLSSKNKLKVISSNLGEPIKLSRIKPDGEEQNLTISVDNLQKIADAVKDKVPFSIDAIVNSSGNWRSAFTSILALCTEFYYCKINNQTHLVWLPESRHQVGVSVEAKEDQYDVDSIYRPTLQIETEDLDKIFDEDYLADRLKETYDPKRKMATCQLYGMKYAKSLESYARNRDKSKRLVRQANIAEEKDFDKIIDYIFQGYNIYLLIKDGYANVRFAEKKRNTSSVPFNKEIANASIEGNERFIDALHSKPFLLLAGISGTGKSRKVQELAYATCPRDGALDADPTSPGNYCLIEVKPNWHDSTELLGYYSNISGKYMLTNFIRFVYKATQHPGIPFFVCLDEMNLAPVEQYFAEYLSVLETRKRILNEQTGQYEIRSAELITKKSFENVKIKSDEITQVDSLGDDVPRQRNDLYTGEELQVIRYIKENGLRLPENLFVIGTVNMDDTTHQFSRKVIDRAFTIEMNGGDLNTLFDEKDTLAYSDKPLDGDTVISSFAKAQEVLDKYPNDAEQIKQLVPELLNRINDEGIFKNTPFRVSYRVENELILYFGSLRMLDNESSTEELVNKAFLTILLEKILPRVEGDEKAMNCGSDGNSKILKNLHAYIDDFKPEDYTDGDGSIYDIISHKLDEMNERVKMSYFTSFFS